ncbi:MAG: BrnT family toxin [Candidatus Omnitrophica bacterium]|nr:BrnT family toxin [Candidatus Omnitrophota bacterium]
MYNGVYTMRINLEALEFEWDQWNAGKNKKHNVADSESEEVFFDGHKTMLRDVLHSHREERFILLGKTKKARLLFLVFTRRGKKIRIISARDLNKKETHLYEKAA